MREGGYALLTELAGYEARIDGRSLQGIAGEDVLGRRLARARIRWFRIHVRRFLCFSDATISSHQYKPGRVVGNIPGFPPKTIRSSRSPPDR